MLSFPGCIAIVPARGGSERVPGKNKLVFDGEPLLVRALKTALGAQPLCVVLSSDDDESLQLAYEYSQRSGEEIILLKRPAAISGSFSPAIEYVQHAVETLERQHGARVQCTAIVQPTSPFTTSDDVRECLRIFHEAKSDSVVSVMEVEHHVHPRKFKKLQEEGRLEPAFMKEEGRMMAHELEKFYVRNGSVYVSSRQTIDSGDLIGEDSRAYVMPRARSVDINDQVDIALCEALLASGAIS